MTSAQLYYDVARFQTEEQDRRRLHFDTMATAILGLSGALIGFIAFTVDEWASWSKWPFTASLVSFSCVAFFTIVELRLRRWIRQPPLRTLREHILNDAYSDTRVMSWTAKQMSRAIQANEKPLAVKARWLSWAQTSLAVHVVLIGILIASAAWTSG